MIDRNTQSILWGLITYPYLNTVRPRQNGRHFPDDIFKCIFLNENMWISIKFSLKFVSKGPINNIPALVQIMVWRRPGDKPLSEPTLVSLLTHICVTRPQWVNLTGILVQPQCLQYFNVGVVTYPWHLNDDQFNGFVKKKYQWNACST